MNKTKRHNQGCDLIMPFSVQFNHFPMELKHRIVAVVMVAAAILNAIASLIAILEFIALRL